MRKPTTPISGRDCTWAHTDGLIHPLQAGRLHEDSMSNHLQIITNDIRGVAERWESVRVDPRSNFEAEAGFAIQTLSANDYALSIAMSNRQSVINAVTNIAAIGISLNPAKKQAYLVPRDGRICLDISYMGLMDLAMQSGSIRWAQCAVVHEQDQFALKGLDQQPSHTFNPFSKDRGSIVGVYCTVKTNDGDYLTHTMTIDDVHGIRNRSSAWKAWEAKKKKCPWVTDEVEMIRKTCVKQACKYWPRGAKSELLENAVQYLNNEAGEGIAFDETAKAPKCTPTGGAMEALEIDVQNVLREVAEEAKDLFSDSGVEAVFNMIERQNMDNDEKVAFWSLLPSDLRSALKKEGKAREEATKAVP